MASHMSGERVKPVRKSPLGFFVAIVGIAGTIFGILMRRANVGF